jgi:hypothetical protein
MKTKVSLALHLGVWCVAVILIIVALFSGKPVEQFTGNLIATLFWLAVYHLFFHYVAPGFLLKKKLVWFFFASVIILLILPFIGYTLLFFTRALFEGNFSDFYKGYSPAMHLSGFKAMVLAGLSGSFFRLIVEYFSK